MSAPGDVGFASQAGFIPAMIKWCQARKYGKNASRFNHCFMVVGWNGELVQANQSGVETGSLRNYGPADNVALRRPPYLGQQMEAVFAMQELARNHDRYGFLTIASCALSLLTGTKLRFGVQDHLICSGAVSYALTRANIDVGDDSDWNTPSDLLAYSLTQNWEKVA